MSTGLILMLSLGLGLILGVGYVIIAALSMLIQEPIAYEEKLIEKKRNKLKKRIDK